MATLRIATQNGGGYEMSVPDGYEVPVPSESGWLDFVGVDERVIVHSRNVEAITLTVTPAVTS